MKVLSTIDAIQTMKDLIEMDLDFGSRSKENPPAFWYHSGLNDQDYVDLWLNCIKEDPGIRFTELPKIIPLQKVLNLFSMDEILDMAWGIFWPDFSIYVIDYCDAGGDIDTLAEKFINEIGYSGESFEKRYGFYAMYCLIIAGATVINLEKFTNLGNSKYQEDLASYQETLKKLGINLSN